MKNKDKKKIAKTGWMPFWWGNKFNKRLASKRARKDSVLLVAVATRELNRRGGAE